HLPPRAAPPPARGYGANGGRPGGARRRGPAQRAARVPPRGRARRAARERRAGDARHGAQVDGEGPVTGREAGAVTDSERLATLLDGARRTVVFPGAGVSTESGIPDFRSPGGVWQRFDPAEFTYRNFVGSVEGRRRYWALGRTTYPLIRAARPGATHRALAELHGRGRLDCCIQQNI